MSTPWTIRPYGRPLDEGFCVSHWLRSWANSQHGRAAGADVEDSPQRAAWWSEHRDYVRALLERETTLMLVSPEEPDLVMAFACLGEGTVHYVLAKRAYHRERLSEELFRALLGERLEQPQRFTHELVEMRKAGMGVPRLWRPDYYWFARRAA